MATVSRGRGLIWLRRYPKAPCGVWELFWTFVIVLDVCVATAVLELPGCVEAHVLHGPHVGRNDHLVDEHVHALAPVVMAWSMQWVSGLVSLV